MITWNEAKRVRSVVKHGIDLAWAEAFDWATALTAIDDRADYGEVREIALGFIGRRLHAIVVHPARRRHPRHQPTQSQ